MAITIAVRRELRSTPRTVWLDSLLGALGAATVLATVLRPAFGPDDGPLALAVVFAYPVFDLLLIATVVGVAGLQGLRVRRHWLPLLVGLSVFTLADVVFAFRVAQDSYVVGTWLDVLWPLAMAMVALWVRARPSPSPLVPSMPRPCWSRRWPPRPPWSCW